MIVGRLILEHAGHGVGGTLETLVLRFGSLQMYITTKGRHATGVLLLAIGTATPEMAFGATSSRRVGLGRMTGNLVN